MTNPVRLLVHGANGRMGQSLQRLCRDENTGCTVIAAVSRKVGARVVDGIPQFAASELAGVPAFDVAVDFSLPEGFDAILGLCVARGAGSLPLRPGESRPEPNSRLSTLRKNFRRILRRT